MAVFLMNIFGIVTKQLLHLRRDVRAAEVGNKELKTMETYKKKNVTNYAFFCSEIILTSKNNRNYKKPFDIFCVRE